MNELAINMNGIAFDVPSSAVGWRVRKMKAKGAPEVVFGRNGQPLVLPLAANVDDLRDAVDVPGRYRLDPVDRAHKPIANASPAYATVPEPARPSVAARASVAARPSDSIVVEALRVNAEIVRAVVDHFTQMVAAGVRLLRSDYAAGPTDGTVRAKHTAFDLGALLVQLVPLLNTLGKWRRAAPASSPRRAMPKHVDDLLPVNATNVLPPIEARAMAHFVAVQSALAPEEAALARRLANELNAAELHAWFDELAGLSIPDAVAKVRKLISGHGKHGGSV